MLTIVPRTVTLDQHATADEDLTLIRSANVALALESGDWWGTYQIGHPEATVQLLVALGLGPDMLRPYAGDFLGPDARTAARVPGYFETLVAARWLMAPVHALLVVVATLLAWRLWGRTIGVLTGVLLALEPFLVAHGRVLRTDALLAELLVVSVLAALAFWSSRAGAWALVVCTLATGLAFLTKTPALALLGAIPAAALAGSLQRHRSPPASVPSPQAPPDRAGGNPPPSSTLGSPPQPQRPSPGGREAQVTGLPLSSGRETGADGRGETAGRNGQPGRTRLTPHRVVMLASTLATWLIGSVALVLALWPAMWARPMRAIERMAAYTQEKGGSPMDAGSFFLGAPVPDPGPLYYAVALPVRLSPLLLVGLLLWPLLRAPKARSGVGLVLLTGLGLAAVLAFLPKKADRYILPAIPFLAVVAAAGIAALTERWKRLRPAGVLGIVAFAEIAVLVITWPYPLAAYNPLLGGAPSADAWISVGWGEGLDQLAPVLNARPDGDSLTVSTPYPEVLQAQIAGRAVDLDAFDVATYAVEYVAARQRRLTSPALDAELAAREPIHRVEIAGVPYAALYELDQPAFDGGLHVRQLDVSPRLTNRRGWITIRLALGPVPPVALVPRPGSTPADTPLEVEASLVNSAQVDDVEATVTRPVTPDGVPAEIKLRAPNSLGRYLVSLSVRDPRTGARLPVSVWPVGAPREPEHLVYPSLSVRTQ